jgi:hypothetical protein
MSLSRLDGVIVFLPVLGILDVLSTFFAAWQGYPLTQYETGLAASFFAQRGLVNLYVGVYLGILVAMSAVLLCIKRDLQGGRLFDKLVFLLLTGVVCIIEATVTSVIVSNLLIGFGGRLVEEARWLIYISVFVVIFVFIRKEAKDMLGFTANGKRRR